MKKSLLHTRVFDVAFFAAFFAAFLFFLSISVVYLFSLYMLPVYCSAATPPPFLSPTHSGASAYDAVVLQFPPNNSPMVALLPPLMTLLLNTRQNLL